MLLVVVVVYGEEKVKTESKTTLRVWRERSKSEVEDSNIFLFLVNCFDCISYVTLTGNFSF